MSAIESLPLDTSPVPSKILRPLLEHWSNTQPDKTFVTTAIGRSWTYAEFRCEVIKTANAMRALGVNKGDTVVSWLPNGMDALLVWFGLNYLGAVYVPINTAYRGNLLEHVIANSDARILVGHSELLPRLRSINLGQLLNVVAIGAFDGEIDGVNLLTESVLRSTDQSLPALEQPVQPWDTQSIIYTSGTTGPSKGVLSSYAHLHAIACPDSFPYFFGSDRFLINLPLFHVGATSFIYAMLMRGGSIVLAEGFRTDGFWEMCRATHTTATILLGVMAQFLLKQPAHSADKNHPLRTAIILPLASDNAGFGPRFGVDVFTIYNMTETCVPTVSSLNPAQPNSCGKVRTGVEIRIVDEHDMELPVNTVGEMIVRTDEPWMLNHGYHNNEKATAGAWRNGWFHTGDAFHVDESGNYYFRDRIKDTIRRRGENISSFEVEVEACAFPSVTEAAAIGVASELGEDEILLVVALIEGEKFDPKAFIQFLQEKLPYFMVPRYLRVLTELPRTPTQKVQKVLLREAGITADTWDRESDPAIVVKRERLRAREG